MTQSPTQKQKHMILSINEKSIKPLEIDLTGPQGNVFYLLGLVPRFAKQLGLNAEEIRDDMKSRDYDYAVEVFERHFGQHVILYR